MENNIFFSFPFQSSQIQIVHCDVKRITARVRLEAGGPPLWTLKMARPGSLRSDIPAGLYSPTNRSNGYARGAHRMVRGW